MKGDFSRLRFDRTKHYAAVLQQQGRVGLDSDANEASEINDHLRTTTNLDVIGGCGAPKHDPGYAITAVPSNAGPVTNFLISKGRLYVDGILCVLENDEHYRPPDATHPGQTDYPDAPWVTPANGQQDLIYLDVWQQHVTSIEDTNLREDALGGPDTTTRLRTICQVKILSNVGGFNCSDDIPKWDALRAERNIGLTTALGAGPADEPCTLAPSGGYTGLENQLYRVEIHSNGGAPTFKWSRDNGSIVVAVNAFLSGTQIQVERLGWDEVRALRKSDWIEVLDDAHELRGEPGELAQITDILPNRVLVVAPAITPGNYKNDGHRRVRRWDQAGPAINVAAGPLTIENRIELQFRTDHLDQYHTGDFWTFAARVGYGDEQGELLDVFTDARPIGIKHHYCKLALVTWHVSGGSLSITDFQDCRKVFPPLTELPRSATCCKVTVGDGVKSFGDYNNIQDAIDDVDDGGTVCILPGDYPLNGSITVQSRVGLTISGCGRAARIHASGSPALVAAGTDGLRLQGLYVESGPDEGAVALMRCVNSAIVGCHFETTMGQVRRSGPALVVSASIGVRVQGSTLIGEPGMVISGLDFTITDNRFSAGGAWLQEGSHFVQVTGNRMDGGAGPGIALGGWRNRKHQLLFTGISSVRIERNLIAGMGENGIVALEAPKRADLSVGTAPGEREARPFEPEKVPSVGLGQIEDLWIIGNTIRGCLTRLEGARVSPLLAGIALHDAARVRVVDNDISQNGVALPCCGVLVHTCEDVEIADNQVVDNGRPDWDGSIVSHPQAGIIALNVNEASEVAVRVHDNLVVCPKGHALVVVAMGPVSVIGNTLASQDIVREPRDQGKLGAVYHTAAGVVVWNGGVMRGLPDFQSFWNTVTTSLAFVATGAPLVAAAPRAAIHAARVLVPDGRTIVQGNQITISAEPGELSGRLPLRTAVGVLSFDDVAFSDNEVAVNVQGMTAVMAMGRTVRTLGNRIADEPKLMSYLGVAQWQIVTGNQATKCLIALGKHVIDSPNHVMAFSTPEEALAACERAKKQLLAVLSQQSFAFDR